ncbi:MAG: DUF6384 family protein [Pseudomonadota bacterium]
MSDPAATPAHDDVGLTDVMLAMDVVDTLRHEERLVARALDDEAREAALIARVKGAYAAQGIAVSDETIETGVAQLKAREFHYDPPAPGFYTRLLTAWTRRARHARSAGFFAGLAAIIGGAWYGLVEWPEQRASVAQASDLNNAVVVAKTERDTLLARHGTLTRNLARADDAAITAATRVAWDSARRDAETALATAYGALEDATLLQRLPTLDGNNLAARAQDVQAALSRQGEQLSIAGNALDIAERSLATLTQLGELPATLRLLRDEGLGLAGSDAVRDAVLAEYSAGSVALSAGNAEAAADAVITLKAMTVTLRSAFTVRIVSRPGEMSGVIREPPSRRGENYYLVVEAVTADGERIPQQIPSEEDGSTRAVSQWGIRVDADVFDRVRRDKTDDGIIQRADVGGKPRGALEITYDIATTGGMIHTWERR